jgi:HEAT repeat protein
LIAYQSIWETFKSIRDKEIQKDEETRLLAFATLNSITNEEIITALADELQSRDKDQCDQAARILTQLGGNSVDPLLDLLEQSHDRSKRAKIVQVLSDIGRAAIPAMTEKIDKSKPWYYLRNLAIILGRIGDEGSVNLLRSLLLNKEYRVQREALNSIYAVGGKKRTEILLSVLLTADDRLKVDIIGMLGSLKWDMAESLFLEMIESKNLAISKTRNDLIEKICIVLGSIGTKKAVPTLRSIVEQKRGLIGKRSYSEKVWIAAKKALAKIEGKGGNDSA